MTEYQEFTGKTVEEALRVARENFGVTGLDDLDFEILTPGSRGVLGMGAEPARIIAAPRKARGGVFSGSPTPNAWALSQIRHRSPSVTRSSSRRHRNWQPCRNASGWPTSCTTP